MVRSVFVKDKGTVYVIKIVSDECDISVATIFFSLSGKQGDENGLILHF